MESTLDRNLAFIIQGPYREMEHMPADSIELIQFVYLLEEIKTGRSEAKQKLKVEDVPWDWRGWVLKKKPPGSN